MGIEPFAFSGSRTVGDTSTFPFFFLRNAFVGSVWEGTALQEDVPGDQASKAA